jgi:hypothetical protein
LFFDFLWLAFTLSILPSFSVEAGFFAIVTKFLFPLFGPAMAALLIVFVFKERKIYQRFKEAQSVYERRRTSLLKESQKPVMELSQSVPEDIPKAHV